MSVEMLEDEDASYPPVPEYMPAGMRRADYWAAVDRASGWHHVPTPRLSPVAESSGRVTRADALALLCREWTRDLSCGCGRVCNRSGLTVAWEDCRECKRPEAEAEEEAQAGEVPPPEVPARAWDEEAWAGSWAPAEAIEERWAGSPVEAQAPEASASD